MQRIVEEVASRNKIPLVDFTALLKAAYSRQYNNTILGKEYFVDHVHTHYEGYRLLALGLFDQLVKEGIVKPDDSWDKERINQLSRQVISTLDVNVQAEALRTLGRTLNWAGKLEEAQNALLKALEMQGPHPSTFDFLVMVLRRQEKYDEAIDYLRQMSAYYPQSAGPRLKLGELLALQDKTDEAIRHLEEGLQLNPNDEVAQTILGMQLAKKGDHEAALLHLNAALNINPRHEAAHFLSARLLTLQQRDDEAEPHLREVLRLNPGQDVAHHDLGALLRKQGKIKEAIQHLSEALRLKPENAGYKNDLQAARG
jgi:tetratricopeptide (TPR) repeat protein